MTTKCSKCGSTDVERKQRSVRAGVGKVWVYFCNKHKGFFTGEKAE